MGFTWTSLPLTGGAYSLGFVDAPHMQVDAESILGAIPTLPRMSDGSYSLRTLSARSGVPRRTLARYVNAPNFERVTEQQLSFLRQRIEHHEDTLSWQTTLAQSYYGHVLSRRVYDPTEGVWKADTSMFGYLRDLGARFDFYVTLHNVTGLPEVEYVPGYAKTIDIPSYARHLDWEAIYQ